MNKKNLAIILLIALINAGFAVSEIDYLEWNTGTGQQPSIIQVSSNVYAIAYAGASADGYIRTVTMDSSGNIGATVIDTLEYDPVDGTYPDIIHISGDVYAVAYTGTGADGWLATFTIDSSGQISDSIISSFEYDISNGQYSDILQISGNVYAIAYTGVSSDGWLATVTINNDGSIVQSVIDSYEWDAADGTVPRIVNVGPNIYAVSYTGTLVDGWVKTFQINNDGSIVKTIIDSYEWDTDNGQYSRIIPVSGNTYAIVYTGTDLDGFVKTLSISSAGAITPSIIDTLEFDPVECYWPSMARISGDYFAVAYRGPDVDGWLSYFTIGSSGVISEVIGSYEYEAVNNYYPSIIPISGNIFAVAFEGDGNDGWLKSFDLQPLSCSTACDGVCQSSTCYGTDPDCGLTGLPTGKCCGNKYCEGDFGESCGTCESDCGVCSANCGDGVCGSGESECNCAADCGACGGSAGTCQTYQCISGTCSPNFIFGCCGNNICEYTETFTNCNLDCNPNYITIKVITPKEGLVVQKNKIFELKVNLTFEQNVKGTGAIVTASGFFGSVTLTELGSGLYAKNITVSEDAESGLQYINIQAAKGAIAFANSTIRVGEELKIALATNHETLMLTQLLRITGNITNSENNLVSSNLTLLIYNNNTLLSNQSLINRSSYAFNYQSSILDISGNWLIIVSAIDEYENRGTANKSLIVSEPELGNYYDLSLISPAFNSYSRKDSVDIIASVSNGEGLITGANVSFKDPFGNLVLMREGENQYGYTYKIPVTAPLGEWKLQIYAKKDLEGFVQKTMIINDVEVLIEILGIEKSSYQLGETIAFEIKAYYSDNEPAELSSIDFEINNESVQLIKQSPGIYLASYAITENKDLIITLNAKDLSMNLGQKDIEIAVQGTSMNYYLIKYPYIIYPAITLAIVAAIYGAVMIYKKNFSKSLNQKKSEITRQIKELQKQYYEVGNINEKTYNSKLSTFEKELHLISNKIKKRK